MKLRPTTFSKNASVVSQVPAPTKWSYRFQSLSSTQQRKETSWAHTRLVGMPAATSGRLILSLVRCRCCTYGLAERHCRTVGAWSQAVLVPRAADSCVGEPPMLLEIVLDSRMQQRPGSYPMVLKLKKSMCFRGPWHHSRHICIRFTQLPATYARVVVIVSGVGTIRKDSGSWMWP